MSNQDHQSVDHMTKETPRQSQNNNSAVDISELATNKLTITTSPQQMAAGTEQPTTNSGGTLMMQFPSSTLTSGFVMSSRDVLRQEEMNDVVQLTASHISQSTASNASTLVQLSNSEKSHEKLEQILPLYFYSWNLTNSHSIILFLILHYFIMRKEYKEAIDAKSLYEEHIVLLKSRMADLEEKLSCSGTPRGGSGTDSQTGSVDGSPIHMVGGVVSKDSLDCEVLKRQIEELRTENDHMARRNEELCRINEQWALDYQSLSDQIKNATGYYSVQSGGGSAPSSTRASPVPAGMFAPPCLQCSQLEFNLDAKNQELKASKREVDQCKGELKKMERKLEGREKDIDRLNNEHHAIMLQLQEIGDLQAAVKMKQDYRNLQYQLSQTNKQYQDAVSEKLQYQKQVENLRTAFMGLFPTSTQTVVQSTADGYFSFPLRTCKRHYNQYPLSDPTPPTPPGLIARGDHHGSLVEKDVETSSLSSAHSQPSSNKHTHILPITSSSSKLTHPSRSHDNHMTSSHNAGTTSTKAIDNTTIVSHDHHMTSPNQQNSINDTTTANRQRLNVSGVGVASMTSSSSSNPSSYESPRPGYHSYHNMSSYPVVMTTTSDYSSSKSLPQFSSDPTQTRSSSPSSNNSSSNNSTSSGVAGSHTHHISCSHVNGGVSLNNSCHSEANKEPLRPLSLTIKSTNHPSPLKSVAKQQHVCCPFCKKGFNQNFDRWFDHMKYCNYKVN